MRTALSAVLLFLAVIIIVNGAPLSEADLKNLLAGIRQNRSTEADFQEQRMIRLMKRPILSSGKVWFQSPNKFRREVKGSSPSLTAPQAGYELTLLPRAASMKRVFQKLELRINDQLRVERTDMLLPNGDRIVTTYSNQTRGPVPASMFEFTAPSGTEVSTPLGR